MREAQQCGHDGERPRGGADLVVGLTSFFAFFGEEVERVFSS
jgi:hypothetical protein